MKFESALELQQKLFKNVFRYIEAAEHSELDDLRIGPFFTSPFLTEAAQRGAKVDSPFNKIALGIGASRYPSTANRANQDYGIVVLCQDRRLLHSAIVEAVQHEARGDARAVYIGPVRQLSWEQSRQRPLRIGSSIGHRRVTAGTLGCFVTTASKQMAVLSNNHVLACVNSASIGDAILQPGRTDGGKDPDHRVGTLHSFAPVSLSPNARNFIDAALATLLPGIHVNGAIYDATKSIGNCGSQTIAQPDIGESVIKVGRTTGLTRGRIAAINVNNLQVAMSSYGSQHVARFDGQIAIEGEGNAAFSKHGDSGSLIMNSECCPVALLFSGSKTGGENGLGLTYGNPIDLVLAALECQIAQLVA